MIDVCCDEVRSRFRLTMGLEPYQSHVPASLSFRKRKALRCDYKSRVYRVYDLTSTQIYFVVTGIEDRELGRFDKASDH